LRFFVLRQLEDDIPLLSTFRRVLECAGAEVLPEPQILPLLKSHPPAANVFVLGAEGVAGGWWP
jgi:hypothetical protein